MQGPAHLMVSWYFAEAGGLPRARDRRIVAWAGLAPDVDVLAYAAALVYYRLDRDLAFENVWRVVHHRYTHGLTFVLLTGVIAYLLSSRATPGRGPLRVAGLAMLASALHNFFDLALGGPTWPIYPFWPLSDFGWYASWSWTIGEWPNVLILVLCLSGLLLCARALGRSPVECFGDRADAWLVRVVREGSSAGGTTRPAAGARRPMLRWVIWSVVLLLTAAILAPLVASG